MTEQTVTQATEETNQARIVVSDIVNCLQIVDTAISRGAFRGSEISYVGKIRDTFSDHVEYQKRLQEAQEKDETLDEEPVRITVGDIAGGLQLIDASIERGAFKGEEATTVGKVRDVFGAFIDEQRKLQEEAQEAQDTDEEEEAKPKAKKAKKQ